MNFIVEFYQSLDALNVIIFWGIIIVILLLIVFIILMINKNKKNKTEITHKSYQDELYSDEIALPSNSRDTLIMKDDNLLIQEEKQTNFEPFVIPEPQVTPEKVEVEKNFQAEEHVMEYDHELFNLSHVKKNNELPPEEQKSEQTSEKQPFQMPTKPYERNVLREMSLGQTSPIGIVKKENSYTKLASNPKGSIVESTPPMPKQAVETSAVSSSSVGKVNMEKEITQVDDAPIINKSEVTRQSEIKKIAEINSSNTITDTIAEETIQQHPANITIDKKFSNYENKPTVTNETIVKSNEEIKQDNFIKTSTSNATFLEEVSRKLAEAEVPDEIDRTDYELQQEEDAIISYKELMAKKDTIKTIDEEDAVISIQELTARKNHQEKLYNLTEEEENNEFIDELKKFRNDLN